MATKIYLVIESYIDTVSDESAETPQMAFTDRTQAIAKKRSLEKAKAGKSGWFYHIQEIDLVTE